METKRIVISKSSKKKMSSSTHQKANAFTEEVVYKTYIGRDKYNSVTKHEAVK